MRKLVNKWPEDDEFSRIGDRIVIDLNQKPKKSKWILKEDKSFTTFKYSFFYYENEKGERLKIKNCPFSQSNYSGWPVGFDGDSKFFYATPFENGYAVASQGYVHDDGRAGSLICTGNTSYSIINEDGDVLFSIDHSKPLRLDNLFIYNTRTEGTVILDIATKKFMSLEQAEAETLSKFLNWQLEPENKQAISEGRAHRDRMERHYNGMDDNQPIQ